MTQRADAKFFAKHSVSELQSWSGYDLEHAGRLTQPLAYDANQDRYSPISWESAYHRIADTLRQLDSPDQAMFYTSGRLTNEPAFIYQLMVRCFGTNNMPDCSNMCHEPTSVMLGRQLGVGKSTVVLEDFEQAKLILMFGQNPATNHPRMLEMLAHCNEQGCRIIAINPMREQGLKSFRNPQKPTHMVAAQSDDMVEEFVQISIGGDVALLTGLAKWLLAHNAIDHAFIDQHTSGFAALKEWLHLQDWTDIEAASGVTQQQITELAQLVADSSATICTWGMGITQHVQGDDNVAMITNLLLMMGMIGIEGAGASPIRGHSNVQGDRTMGIHESPKQSLLDSLEQVFDRPMPQEHGYNAVEGAQALIQGKLKVFMSVGGNYSVAAPDTDAIQQALTQNQLNVFVATKLNETMLYPATDNIILPCLSRTERMVTSQGNQFTTIEDSICQIVASQGSLTPISKDLKAESQIIAGIASALFETNSEQDTAIPWFKMGEDLDFTRDYIARTINGFENFNYRIRKDKRGFHLYHPARHRQWQTDSGKAQFEVPKHPINYNVASLQLLHKTLNNPLAKAADITPTLTGSSETAQDTPHTAWQLTSVRSHDQFNTIIFGFHDRYRNTNRRDVLFMHPDEISRMGWQVGDKVAVSRQDVQGNIRRLAPLVLKPMDIAANAVATYYPECNNLMDLGSHSLESFTPSYKSVAVTLERIETTIPVTAV